MKPHLLGAGGGRIDVPAEEGVDVRRVFQTRRQLHLAEARRAAVQRRAAQIVAVDSLPAAAVEVEQPGAGLAEIAGGGRQQRAGAHHVAAALLPLQPLAQPEQGGAGAVEARRLLDQGRRDSRLRRAPGGGAGRERRFQRAPADGVGVEERPVDQPVAGQHVEHGEGEGGVAAGEGLEVQVGPFGRGVADGVDDDHRARRLLQPVLVLVRGRGGRVRAPDHDAARVPGGARVEPDDGTADDVIEGDVAGHVADGVRLDLPRAEPPQEAQREVAGDEGTGAGVMRVHDLLRAGAFGDRPEARRDGSDGLVPGDRRESPLALGADALQGPQEPRLRVAEHAVVGERALAAEGAAAHRVVRVAQHAGDPAAAPDGDDAAGVVAIARAGGLEDFLVAGHGAPPDLAARYPTAAGPAPEPRAACAAGVALGGGEG